MAITSYETIVYTNVRSSTTSRPPRDLTGSRWNLHRVHFILISERREVLRSCSLVNPRVTDLDSRDDGGLYDARERASSRSPACNEAPCHHGRWPGRAHAPPACASSGVLVDVAAWPRPPPVTRNGLSMHVTTAAGTTRAKVARGSSGRGIDD